MMKRKTCAFLCVFVCAAVARGLLTEMKGDTPHVACLFIARRRSDQIKHPRNQGDISRSGASHREMQPHVLQRDGRVAETSTAVSH